ncbi:MAG: GNAT family N-acetyltransferase [Clostridia bacterium]|nr:GNAT family N-acetyltransferase [Clostridia bacterium]
MQITSLSNRHTDIVMDLFVRCFYDDHYYAQLFPDPETRKNDMRSSFSGNISLCLAQGLSLGLWEGNELTAFLICFDYHKMLSEDEETFLGIFGGNPHEIASLPYYDAVHSRIADMECPVLFLLSIAVRPDRRRFGLASVLVDSLIHAHPDFGFAGDVSNEDSLEIYRKRHFQIYEIDTAYHLILRKAGVEISVSYETDKVKLAVPSTAFLEKYTIPFQVLHTCFALPDVRTAEYFDETYFSFSPGSVVHALVIEIRYRDLLAYQRYINPVQNMEKTSADVLYYVLTFPYENPPLMNELLAEMLPSRKTEWNIIPDLYVSVPVQYDSAVYFRKQTSENDILPRHLMRNLDYRTQYEVGIPSSLTGVDELSHLKSRLKRYSLGKHRIRILNEITLDNYTSGEQVIGAPAYAEFYITIDTGSSCAVVTWYSLSAPFLLSHYMDNVIKNQLQIFHTGKWINIYEFFSTEYRITKRGTPKIYAVIPEEKSCLANNQLASLLASETIYPDGESFGSIIDADILEAVNSTVGMGQYDRGFICAYTNVMLQFSPDLRCRLTDRIGEESIALFFTELILLEEAAIKIADQSMIRLFSTNQFEDPVHFLEQVEDIYEHYSRTIDFWDVQINYPTSQKSMRMMRNAFQIPKMLEEMQRTREHLQTVFDTTSNMIDRKDNIRINASLTIISMLAVISALLDSYDYIAVWSGLLSADTVSLLQKISFIVIFLIGVYAAANLITGKILKLLRKRKKKNHKK